MKEIFFIGSYAKAEETGVYAAEFDNETGEVRLLASYAGLQNPTFLSVDADDRRLYAIAELLGPDGGKRGAVAAFAIDASHGLSLLNIEETVPAPTCHVELDRTRRWLLTSSYHGGMVGVTPVYEEGQVGPASDIQRHQGSSVLPVQDRPRAHSATLDRNNRFAVVCDLGADRIVTYRLDEASGKLIYASSVAAAPGAGPRHFAFHPSRMLGYAINELNSTVAVYTYDEMSGELAEIQTVPTLPDDFHGDNACADIHISPDGKFLYGSNRGHDSIVVYRIDVDGRLSWVEHASVLGAHPRNFALTPDGSYVLAANRDTNDVVVFRRNAATGKLRPTGHRLSVSKPVCIKFL